MKKLITLILFTFISTLVFAQNNYQDVVYLKNGSVIRGIMIEQIPNETIKIETADRSIFVYKMDEIEKITKEEKKVEKSEEKTVAKVNVQEPTNTEGSGLQTGYRGIAEFGYQFGLGDYGLDRFKFNMINGGQVSPFFFIGGGVGLRYYFDDDVALVPVFVHARANVLDNKVSPYFALSIGYSFNATDDFSTGGLMVSPATGVTFVVSKKVNLNVGLSYEMQSVEFYYYNYYGYSTTSRENSGALSIDFGLSF